ncbi:hypothetical protein ISS04_02685 [Candidatus Woesearchaeota archaeon]|nr:hypothetical protein [Candidatus Woesearchaeota archaeon]
MNKLPLNKIAKISKLRAKGKSIADIARETGIHYNTVYGHTSLKEKGFDSWKNYRDYMTNKRADKLSEKFSKIEQKINLLGYDIEKITKDKDSLVVRLSKEDTPLDSTDPNFISSVFEQSLEQFLEQLNKNADINLFYEKHTMYLTPEDTKSKSILQAYRQTILERELIK